MILVTGSTGLVGSHLIYDLLSEGFQVKALVRKSSDKHLILRTFKFYTSNPEQLFNKIVWVEGDVTDLISLEEAFTDVEKVYHTAAFVSFNHKDKKKIFDVNVDGTANIVNLCLDKAIKKLCFVSSIAALGVTDDDSLITEDVLWKPVKNSSPYSVSKFKSEMEVWRGITEGLNAVIVNPSVILGPGYWKNSGASVFRMVEKGFPFYTLGTTGFVDVKDVSKAMIMLMESAITNDRFIVSSENLSYKSFFEIAANSLQVKSPHIQLSPFMAGVAWRLERIRSYFFFSSPKITKDTVGIAFKKLMYSSEKIKSNLHVELKPIESIINDLSAYYLKSKKNNQLD